METPESKKTWSLVDPTSYYVVARIRKGIFSYENIILEKYNNIYEADRVIRNIVNYLGGVKVPGVYGEGEVRIFNMPIPYHPDYYRTN